MTHFAARTSWFLRVGASVAGALALLAAAVPPASAGGSTCSGQACILVEGSGLYVSRVTATPAQDAQFYGHFRMYGGGVNGDSAVQVWHKGSRYTLALGHGVPDHTKFCVEAWEHINDQKRQVGRTCVDIHA
ncbi:hypothetical protein FHS39_002727 [Streptomyces olivoverticillatus]|uniref:Secreted protein n=1 Tax=Streptomyces olivoverticillatus TaxID=66427 RepID=A0A7W7LQ69_9ACTN|nr:hypothetical protein [Streptomyces olivoverticillatus]MBB4893696.1 hypothetical protein [Streptomyces olivoverticillatus]